MKVWWISFFWIALLNVGLLAFSWSQSGRSGLAWGILLALSINYYLILYSPLKKLCPGGHRRLQGQDPWGVGEIVTELSARLKVAEPEVYLWQTERIQCFIFSKWPGKAKIGISEGALKSLNPEEIRLLFSWCILALKSGRVVNWSYLGLFLNLIFIFLSSVDRILSWMVTKKINQPHGITLWLATPLIYFIQRLFCRRKDFFTLEKKLKDMGINPDFSARVLKKIHFQNQTFSDSETLAFAHLYYASQIPRRGVLPVLRIQPSYKKRVRAMRGSYPI